MFFDPETGRRCRRNGTGATPLCQRHREEIDGEPTPFAEILRSVISGKRPSQQSVEDATRSVMEGIFGRTMSAEELKRVFEQARGTQSSSASSGPSPSGSDPGARSSSSRGQEQSEAEKSRRVSWARRTLGFTAREPLTKETVKKRFRELARKHHPDVGGTDAKMADLNRAVEILVG